MNCEQVCQIWRRCAPPFLSYLRKTGGGGHNIPPPPVRVLNSFPMLQQIKVWRRPFMRKLLTGVTVNIIYYMLAVLEQWNVQLANTITDSSP